MSFFSRRHLVFGAAAAAALPCLRGAQNPTSSLPVADLHVHPSGRLTIERAGALSRERKVAFGMVEHLGPEYAIKTDEDLKRYIESVRKAGMWVGLQPTFPGWRKHFSKDLVGQLEYVLMDALELPNPDGSRWLIWRNDTQVDDKQKFMDRYLDFYLQILSTEGLQILAATTFVPAGLEPEYETLWTEKRMRAVIDAALKHKVALEITQYYRQPQAKFIRMAKAAGAKFTFGTNGRTEQEVGAMPYCIKVAEECGLTAADLWRPKRDLSRG